MLEIKLQQPLDLDLTLDSGQCFRWRKINDWWYGVVDRNVWKVKVEGSNLLVKVFLGTGRDLSLRNDVVKYFNLDRDYLAIIDSIRKDDSMKLLTDNFRGMTVLNQDPYETLLSYILTANNNVLRVKGMVTALSKAYGKKIETDVGVFYTFPTLSELRNVAEDDFRKLKFGFRAKYFKAAVGGLLRMIDTSIQSSASDYSVSAGSFMSDFWQSSANDKSFLTNFYGVGDKIADCTRVYSLGCDEVVPVDVWIRRILIKNYNLSDKMKYRDIQDFSVDYFGDYAGWAQLFLFSGARNKFL